MCDSTNSVRDGVSPSEHEVSEGLRQIIENAEGRVAVTTFSSNVGRIARSRRRLRLPVVKCCCSARL